MAEALAKHLEAKGMAEGADHLAEALQKALPSADAASLQVRHASGVRLSRRPPGVPAAPHTVR